MLGVLNNVFVYIEIKNLVIGNIIGVLNVDFNKWWYRKIIFIMILVGVIVINLRFVVFNVNYVMKGFFWIGFIEVGFDVLYLMDRDNFVLWE